MSTASAFGFRSSTLLAALFVACGALSCGTPHQVRGADNDGLRTGRLASVNPLEVVVPPIENNTGVATIPLSDLRAKFHAGLVKLRYTPLSLDYVDRNGGPIEAGYRPGSLGEQATLRVVLTGWDDSLWQSRSKLVVDADVYLLDAADAELSKALWGGHVTRNIDLSLRAAATATPNAMLERATAEFVDGVLASLPPRNPER